MKNILIFLKKADDNNATCLQNGTETAICDRIGCGQSHTRIKLGTALGHSYTNYIYDNNATCLQNGTETAICDNLGCSEIGVREKTGTVLGHYFSSPSYVWNEDTCVATVTCLRNSAHVKTEAVKAFYIKDSFQTCEETEKGHFEAHFINSEFSTQVTPINSILKGEPLGHTYINRKCINCGGLQGYSQGLACVYNLDDDSCTITGIGDCTDTDVSIPCFINGYKVTAIGKYAFYKNEYLTGIVIPDSVTSIGDQAFIYCRSLASINFNGTKAQ